VSVSLALYGVTAPVRAPVGGVQVQEEPVGADLAPEEARS
jgi:hypothetical protein